MLAFKSTHLTRWHLDPPIPEAQTLHERFIIHFLHNIYSRKLNECHINTYYLICISFQHDHTVIEWEGNEPIEAAITETTLSELASQDLDDIVVYTFFPLSIQMRFIQFHNVLLLLTYKLLLFTGQKLQAEKTSHSDKQSYRLVVLCLYNMLQENDANRHHP